MITMTVTSFYFFVFLIMGVSVYYLVPKKLQWMVLLGCSVVFYFFAASFHTIIYLVISTLIAYLSTLLMERRKARDGNNRFLFWITMTAIVVNIGMWFVLKGSSFWMKGLFILNRVSSLVPVVQSFSVVGALGMAYYTSQVIGYILDVYWGNAEPQHNPLKLFLFVCYFPQLTVGPISRYNDLKTIYDPHRLSYQNISFGCQRILWGLFKKLVISDRVGIIVNGIWSDIQAYTGIWWWIAVFLFPLQLYTDFSGCMDIVLGVSELFDIHLKENFRNPFFSRNSQEFWQRWHITLGTWARDYVYYPVLKSKFLVTLGKKSKKRFGKRWGKFIPWTVGMAILWFVMGFWHGSMQHIVGVSLWFWSMLVLSELFKPVFDYSINKIGIKTDVTSWHIFQSVRTYFVYSLGAVAFSSVGIRGGLEHYKLLLHSGDYWNPWVLFDKSILNLGVTWQDVNLIIVGVLFLFIVAILREKHEYARLWIQKQNLIFRWLIWFVLFSIVLIEGLYGEGYDASLFIYQGF